MENKLTAPTVPTSIHFIPSGPIDTAARKAIRSHVTLDIRRKQRQQKLLTLQTKPSKPKGIFLEDSFCKCLVLRLSYHNFQPEKKSPKSRPAIQRQQLADSYKICPKCQGVQFSALSEQGQLRAAKNHPSVVAILQGGLDPFHTTPEVPNLSPIDAQIVNEIKTYFITFMTPGILKTTLLPAANQTPALLMGILYLSCWNLAALRDEQDRHFASLAMVIKKEAIHQINKLLSNPKKACTTETISAIGWVAAGIWCLGESTALEEVNAHEQGMLSLVSLGPTWNPGQDEPLGKALVKLLVLHEFVRYAMSGVPIEEHLLIKYVENIPTVSKSDVFAESPLFCPLDDFYNIRSSGACSERIIRLLHSTKRLVDATLAMDPTLGDSGVVDIQEYELAKTQLNEMLLVEEKDPMQADYVYESCRLASLLMARAIDTGTPFSELDNRIADQLKFAMQKTDIGNVWGPLSGVLWWVCLVGASVATIGAPQHRYMDTVLRQTMHDLIYKSPFYEAMTVATAKFVRIKALLGLSKRSFGTLHQPPATSPVLPTQENLL